MRSPCWFVTAWDALEARVVETVDDAFCFAQDTDDSGDLSLPEFELFFKAIKNLAGYGAVLLASTVE